MKSTHSDCSAKRVLYLSHRYTPAFLPSRQWHARSDHRRGIERILSEQQDYGASLEHRFWSDNQDIPGLLTELRPV
jgi:hypothetical protein